MLKQFFYCGQVPATAPRSRQFQPAACIGAVIGGVFLATLSTPANAESDCLATGQAAVIGPRGFNFVPFASGGSINALVSAIDAANSAFLTQSTAFIGSPPNPEPNQLGGGVWARAIGGESTFKSTSTSTYAIGGAPLSGNITCNTKTKLDYAGAQIGADVARLNIDGWNLHGGSTLGYLGAAANDYASGGGFSDRLQIPFVGIYGAVTKGGLFIDGQARWSYFQNQLSDPQAGVFRQNLDARGFSIGANIGYNHALPDNWFIEPSAGVLWSKVTVDPFQMFGTLALSSPGLAPPSTVEISDIYSTLGRVSVRAGTSFNAGGVVLQPFATISGFHEFVGNQTSMVNTSFAALNISFPEISGKLSTTNIGTYGQFGLGVVALVPNTGWLAYIRGDYRTGPKVDGWNMNAGLRYQLTSPNPVLTARSSYGGPAVPVGYDWSGFYLGPSLGVDWGYTQWTFLSVGTKAYPRFGGMLPGGQIGYNYQMGQWVVGIEGDAGWSNAHGARACPNGFGFNCEIDVNFLSTVTGRVGFAYWDRVLWYGKGGLAIGKVAAQGRCNTDSQLLISGGLLNPGCPAQGTSNTALGWTVGAGTEFGLTENWSVRAETSYFNLGKAHYTFGPLDSPVGVDISRTGFIASIGLNYRFAGFGAAPTVVAKY
jgi:opacity protein-like surface antigen